MDEKKFEETIDLLGELLYNEINYEYPKQSIVYSTTSLGMCLGMVRFAATGHTANEVHVALGFPTETLQDVAKAYGTFLRKYNDSKYFGIYNKVYMKDLESAQQEFTDIMRDEFKTKTSNLNFSESSAIIRFNSWIERQTEGRYKNFMKPDDYYKRTVIAFVNIVLFKSEWQFKNDLEGSIQEEYECKLNSTFSLKLPVYIGPNFSEENEMWEGYAIELPQAKSNRSRLSYATRTDDRKPDIKRDRINFRNVLSKHSPFNKQHWPILQCRTEVEIELSNILKRLGMTDMFRKDALFANILGSFQSLRVLRVRHKTTIDLDNKGSDGIGLTVVQFTADLNQTKEEQEEDEEWT